MPSPSRYGSVDSSGHGYYSLTPGPGYGRWCAVVMATAWRSARHWMRRACLLSIATPNVLGTLRRVLADRPFSVVGVGASHVQVTPWHRPGSAPGDLCGCGPAGGAATCGA